jgi:hypothetical protein
VRYEPKSFAQRRPDGNGICSTIKRLPLNYWGNYRKAQIKRTKQVQYRAKIFAPLIQTVSLAEQVLWDQVDIGLLGYLHLSMTQYLRDLVD